MATATLQRIDLTSFKTFERAQLPLDGVTVLTGRNSAGKSNALDAIEVLARLASGDDLHDALDGRGRAGGAVRGGSRGCAPHGRTSFALGCQVGLGNARYRLEVVIEVEPVLRITSERLVGPAPAVESGDVESRSLLWSRSRNGEGPGLPAEVHNGRRGTDPVTVFRDDRLLTSQLAARLAPTTDADHAVLRAAEAVLTALTGAFHLDPVPHLMRGYVPERDATLRRTGENISATLAHLHHEDPAGFDAVTRALTQVADHRVLELTSEASALGDVMLALREGPPGEEQLTPAREMSDGLLRFLAIATALTTADLRLDIDAARTLSGVRPGVLLVIEEIENGLHPSQAGRLLELMRHAASPPQTRVLVTTHSPALLNAMTGSFNKSVVVCYRDEHQGTSRLSRVTELPGYAQAIAGGDLGDAVSRGQLVRPRTAERDLSAFNRLVGLD